MAAAQVAMAENRLDEVERLCNLILADQKAFPPATFFLAIAASRRGNRRRAVDLLKETIRIDPRSFEAVELLANLHREHGEFEDCLKLCSRMLQLRPGSPGGPAAIGLCYLDQNLPSQALSCFERAVALAPRAAAFHLHLARALEQLLRLEEAEAEYREAISLDPDVAMLHEALGKMLFKNRQLDKGLASLRKAVQLDPTPGRLLLLGGALSESGAYEEAEPLLGKAVQEEPSLVEAHELLGYALQVLGRFEEAEGSLQKALALDPSRARPYLSIVGAKTVTEQDCPFVVLIEKQLANGKRSKDDLRQLNYALGKAYSDLGRNREAMDRYDRANELAFIVKRNMIPFDLEAQRSWIDRAVATFTKSFFENHREVGSDSQAPVFIVGMIRSGTTLTDQILSSHTRIGSAGEVQFWAEPRRAALTQALLDGSFPRSELLAAASEHLALLQNAAPAKQRVIDKMPRNYLILGVIHLLFPNARIIHCRRDPVDTCLSIYTTPLGTGAEFCYNRQSIVDAYREYLRVMDHWRRVIPENLLMEIDYEELVEAEEVVARRLVEFCALPWESACLLPQDNRRAVDTPSLWQVRQPIYKTSVRRSDRFEPWLREFSVLRRPPIS